MSLQEMRQYDFVAHYSIPNFDSYGGATDEDPYAIESAKLRVRAGDLLVSRLNPRKQRVLFAEHHDTLAVCSGEFVVLQPTDAVDARFLYWRFLAEDTRQLLHSRVRSVTRSQQRVEPDEIRKYWMHTPPLVEQRTIARRLDEETKRIDGLVSEQQNLKSLLGERLLANRETLLLDPGRDKTPGWDHGRLKRFITVARGRFTHRPRNDPALYDGPYPFIQTGDIAAATDGVVESWSQTLNELGLAASRMAPARTMVMAIAANIGDVARLGFDACFPDSVVAIAPRSQVTPEYVFELIQALRKELIVTATLNTQLNINVERIGDIEVAIPPIPEQGQLVAALARQQSDATAVISEIDHQITLLQEHRQALITAAVTGGLDALDEVA